MTKKMFVIIMVAAMVSVVVLAWSPVSALVTWIPNTAIYNCVVTLVFGLFTAGLTTLWLDIEETWKEVKAQHSKE